MRAHPRSQPVHAPRERFGPDPVRVAARGARTDGVAPAILVAGGGAVASGAFDGVRALAELLECPVVTTMSGQGTLEEHHRLSLGVCGSMGNPIANSAIADADTVVYIGCKAGQAATLNYTTPAAGTTVIQIEIDPEEIGRNLPADARAGRRRALRAGRADGRAGAGRRRTVMEWDVGRPPRRAVGLGVAAVGGAVQLTRGRAAAAVDHRDGRRAHLGRRCGRGRREPGGGLDRPTTSRSSGRAGTRWRRAAWRASAGVPRRRWELRWHGASWVCRVARCSSPGDGAFAYSVAELEVMRRLELPVTAVILNNRTLGWIKHIQEFALDDYLSVDFCDVDFSQVAKGFGVPAWRVSTPEQLDEALRAAGATAGPALVEVVTDPTETPVLSISEHRAAPRRPFQGEL